MKLPKQKRREMPKGGKGYMVEHLKRRETGRYSRDRSSMQSKLLWAQKRT